MLCVTTCYDDRMAGSLTKHDDRSPDIHVGGFVLGRDRFAKISAVEGIALTDEMRMTLERFDRDGLSAEERRQVILRSFTPKS